MTLSQFLYVAFSFPPFKISYYNIVNMITVKVHLHHHPSGQDPTPLPDVTSNLILF